MRTKKFRHMSRIEQDIWLRENEFIPWDDSITLAACKKCGCLIDPYMSVEHILRCPR